MPVFNRVIPFLRVFMNNRDHRKITVVDGREPEPYRRLQSGERVF